MYNHQYHGGILFYASQMGLFSFLGNSYKVNLGGGNIEEGAETLLSITEFLENIL
jgi:hypothetical protein